MFQHRKTTDAPPPGRRRFLQLGAGMAAGGLLAGCAAPAGGAKGVPIGIDVHAHWTPEPYARRMAELGRPTFANGSVLNPLMYDIPRRMAWMDEHNIKTHVLTLSGNMPWWWATPADAKYLAQSVNESALEAHARVPDRFLVGLAVPIAQPEAALAELNRMAGKPGVCAVGLPNSMNGEDYLFKPEYAPFLKRCEELGYPLLFHPLDFPPNYFAGPERLAGPSFIYNTVGFPTEHANTAEKFIVTGTLDRYPKLKILLAHAGGSFPFIAARLNHAIKMKASNVVLQQPYETYIRRFHYDTLTYSVPGLQYLIDTVGIDRIVIGTDVFAAMAVTDPMELVNQLRVPQADKDLIARGNAVKLLNLKG